MLLILQNGSQAMVPPKRKLNPKRRLHPNPDLKQLGRFADQVAYGGHPHHKRSPGDFGLTPPSSPRPNKSLCDGVGIFQREVAQHLLVSGMRRGIVSPDTADEFPRYVWSVTDEGIVLEARCDDPRRGRYHGYPLEPCDPMTELVRQRWREAE